MLLPVNIKYTKETLRDMNEVYKQYYSDLKDILLNNTSVSSNL